MENDVWIEQLKNPELGAPFAVVGSSGMRSIGKQVVDNLIEEKKAFIIAELYSTHLPVVYQTKPTFAAHPSLPGSGGVTIDAGLLDLPRVQIYASSIPQTILVRGYHANFDGQYEIASRVIEYLKELQIRRLIVVAGFGSKEKKICCAATSPEILQEMKEKFNILPDYKGPFYGFSGLAFGQAKLKGLDALCLFSGTQPNPEDPESPDKEASQTALDTVKKILAHPQQTT
jgi:proteasome assembly chaperone (PAC2) family protein